MAAQGGAPAPPQSGQCNLDNAVINLTALRDHEKKELTDIISSVGGKKGKVLILDPELAGPLSLIVEIGILKDLGVEKIFYLSPGYLDTDKTHLIYICRPNVKYMRYIAEHIKGHKEAGQGSKSYSVFFVPRRTMICERILEEEGVYQNVMLGEYHLDLIPFDEDVLSLELPNSFKECNLESDRTSLFYVAKALMKLQSLFGIIPNIKGKGVNAQIVAELMLKLRRSEMGAQEPMIVPEIDTVILIDRMADLVTPVCTQLTYEGLIDEFYGINNSTVDLPNDMIVDPKAQNNQPKKDQKPPEKKKIKVPLNSNDKIYRDIRDLNFSVIGPILNQKAKLIDQYYKERHKAQTVSQIKDFMKKLSSFQQEHQFLRIHTNIAESILKTTREQAFHTHLEAEQNLLVGTDIEASEQYIEECIAKQDPLVKVLRLLCLYSLTIGGLKEKQYQFFSREIIQTYGYQYMFTLDSLAQLGMLKKQDNKGTTFPRLRKDIRLIVEDIDEQNPKDIAYVYSGYAPLTVRLVELAGQQTPGTGLPSLNPLSLLQKGGDTPQPDGQGEKENESKIYQGWGWPRADELLRLIPGGPGFHAKQALHSGLKMGKTALNALIGLGTNFVTDKTTTGKNAVTLVFFIGGMTYTEVAAMRFLNQQSDGRDFLLATTKMINGDSFLDFLVEDIERKPESLSM